jgi:transcription antitermination factor NusA-like protein
MRVDPVKEMEEDKKLLERATDEIESLQAESDKLTAERGQAESELAYNVELLAVVAPQASRRLAGRAGSNARRAEMLSSRRYPVRMSANHPEETFQKPQ